MKAFYHWIILTALILSPSTVIPQTPAPSPSPASITVDNLAGLWKARRWFGPIKRGALVVTRWGASYTADIAGRLLAVRHENGELVFEFPNGEGKFRGKLERSGTILGHWFPPPSTAQFTGGVFASPVLLKPDGRNRWRGEVVPIEDEFTFFLMAQKRTDGTMGVILRNPDQILAVRSAPTGLRWKAISSSCGANVPDRPRNESCPAEPWMTAVQYSV